MLGAEGESGEREVGGVMMEVRVGRGRWEE